MTKTETKQTASEVLVGLHSAMIAELERIKEAVQNLPAPSDRTHWANVGDAAEMLRRLREVLS